MDKKRKAPLDGVAGAEGGKPFGGGPWGPGPQHPMPGKFRYTFFQCYCRPLEVLNLNPMKVGKVLDYMGRMT